MIALTVWAALAALQDASNGLTLLDASNWQEFHEAQNREHRSVLVLFTEQTAECSKCRSAEAVYQQAALSSVTRERPTVLAKVDVALHEDLARRFQVTSVPKAVLFRGNGSSPEQTHCTGCCPRA